MLQQHVVVLHVPHAQPAEHTITWQIIKYVQHRCSAQVCCFHFSFIFDFPSNIFAAIKPTVTCASQQFANIFALKKLGTWQSAGIGKGCALCDCVCEKSHTNKQISCCFILQVRWNILFIIYDIDRKDGSLARPAAV